jgi:hypothetical protein
MMAGRGGAKRRHAQNRPRQYRPSPSQLKTAASVRAEPLHARARRAGAADRHVGFLNGRRMVSIPLAKTATASAGRSCRIHAGGQREIVGRRVRSDHELTSAALMQIANDGSERGRLSTVR